MRLNTGRGNEDVSLAEQFRRRSSIVTGALAGMRAHVYADGAVPAKHQLATAVALSIALRCERCLCGYVLKAKEAGLSMDELVEFLEVAMTMQGCPGEAWARKAYEIFKEESEGIDQSPHPPCCDHS